METICEKAFERALSQMAAKILKHERVKEFHFKISHLHITTEQNLNSDRSPKKPRIQCFEIHCRAVLLT